MTLDRRTGALVIAAACVALSAVVVYALLRDSEVEPPAGYETQETLLSAGFILWNELKQRDYQPPDGFRYRGDEWGNALDVTLDKCELRDIPDRLLHGQELGHPPEEMGYLIIVTSRGPDGLLETDDDLTLWRINSIEDGYLKGQGEVYNEDVWPELTAYLRRIRGTGVTDGG